MFTLLEHWVAQFDISGTGFSMCLLDIDQFKHINDLYGHQAGDAVLVDFARRVGAAIRQRDAFGRVGGEEFMVLLPNTALGDAVPVIERVMEIVRLASPLPQSPPFAYRCSAGLAAYSPGETSEAFYARADAALYAAKAGGKDRISTG